MRAREPPPGKPPRLTWGRESGVHVVWAIVLGRLQLLPYRLGAGKSLSTALELPPQGVSWVLVHGPDM